MKTNTSQCVKASPVISVIKPYKPKFEIVNVFVDSAPENESITWFLNLVNSDGQIFKYTLNISEE
jgi:hypothetical protein